MVELSCLQDSISHLDAIYISKKEVKIGRGKGLRYEEHQKRADAVLPLRNIPGSMHENDSIFKAVIILLDL
jgi:hypothetical protein